jgi:taurine transport system permease protein
MPIATAQSKASDESGKLVSPRFRAFVRFPNRSAVAAIITAAVVLGGWWSASHWRLVEPLFLPTPEAVLEQAIHVSVDGFVDATLAQHTLASLTRISVALVAAILTGIPVGLAMGLNAESRGGFGVIIEFYRPIPPLAYLPLIVVWFGIGEFSKVLLIYLAILAPVVIATAAGVRTIDSSKINAARSLGASFSQVTWFVVLPSALPSILTGVRIGIGAGWATLVAAELVAATRGLGFMVQSASQYLLTDIVLLGIFEIAIIAYALELVVLLAQRFFVPWLGHV